MARLNGFCLLLAACCYLLVPFLCKPSAAVTRKFFSCKITGSKGGKPYDCYHGKCWCTKTRANCSHNNGGLLFVPKLPRGIQFLDLSHNNLSTIPEKFFANVTDITSLSLSTNNIANISDGAFKQLKRLEVVVFDNNFYLHNMIKPVFEAKTLKCVDFRHGKLKNLPENIYDSIHLEEMYFHDNYLRVLNLSRFENLKQLRVLGWAGNYAHSFSVGPIENLQNLDLSNNQLTFFPDACRASGRSFLPRLKWLNLRDNKIDTILDGAPACMPWLQDLELSGNYYKKLQSNMFCTDRFPFLTNLYLENMQQPLAHVNNFAFNNTHLQKISLMDDRLKFADEGTVELDSFAGCPGLLSLQLSGNVFSGLSDDRFLRLFGHLTETDTIYMGRTSLERISPKTFANFPRLKKLYLYMNKIAEFPDAAFANNPILQELNMNDNQFTTVKETAFTKANREKLRMLDLSGNPFSCDCDLRWFSDWLRSNKTLFKRSHSSYTCSSNLHQEVASFTVPDQACLLSPATSEFIVVSFTILLVTMTAVSAVFCYRWHLRLVLYEVFRGRNDNRRRRLEEGNFDYDVFVSYASEDLPWVREHLMPGLEDRLELRLCVHERDFIPGKNIVENIADCVESSKKILMVFSNDFVRSQWCQFELAFCLRHAMDTDDVLVVVCVDDVASRDLTSSMMAVMKTTTYIQWVVDRDAMASFWGRLRMAFEEIVLDGHQQRDLA